MQSSYNLFCRNWRVHMKFLKVFLQILILYSFFLVGDWLHDFFHLPLPGSIIGLLLLWASLLLNVFHLRWIESGSHFLLSYLPLYLIPATVGAMNYGHIFVGKGFILILLMIVSTLITMGISGYTSQIIARQSTKRKERTSCKL